MSPRIFVLWLSAAVCWLRLSTVSHAIGNDDFADRVPLSGATVSAVSNAVFATREPGEARHGARDSVGGSLWWSWTAPSTGLANFSTLGSDSARWRVSSSAPGLAVYTGGGLTGLTEIGNTNALAIERYALADAGMSLSVPVVAGQSYQIAFGDGSFRTDQIALNINRPPTIVSNAAATAALGASFSYWIEASGSPSSYQAGALPTGLIFNPLTGVISGVPLQSGVFSIPIEAANNAGSGAAILTLAVSATSPPATVTPPVFFGDAAVAGTVGDSFSYYPLASSGVSSYSLGALPPGLVFETSSARITGVPTAAGTFQVNISATNSAGTSTAIVTLMIAAAPPAPVISSSAFASGAVGSPVSFYISASDSPTSRSASNLPPGLALDSSGYISGTPTAEGIFTVPVSATNAGGTGTAVLTFTIAAATPPPPTLLITSNNTASGVVGTAFTYAINGGNTATSFTASGLPPGLSVNSQTGYITGVPSAAGVFNSLITASDGNATVSATIQFTITTKPVVASGTSIVTFTSSAGATGTVGKGFSYNSSVQPSSGSTTVSASGLPPGLTISSFGAISGTPTVAGIYPVTLSATISSSPGSPMTGSAIVTIRILASVPAPDDVPLITSSASGLGYAGSSFSYSIAATGNPGSFAASGLPAGLTVNATTGSITGTPTVAGVFGVTVMATNGLGTGSATLLLDIRATIPAPVITSGATASGTVGIPFSTYTISISGGTSYSTSGLPPGLSLNPANGQISGTPTTAGVFSVPISGTSPGGTANAVLTITIAAAQPVPVISSSLAASGVVGTSFSYSVSASNSPTSYGAGNLPSGLNMTPASGTIAGTPTVAGVFAVLISATNSGGTGSATVTLTIAAAPPRPVISNAATASGNTGTAFNFSLAATNSPTGYTASGLPAGLALNTTSGAITGTPTVAGVFSVPFSATNAGGTTSATLTLTIAAPATALPPVFSSSAAARAVVDAAFSHTLMASNTPTSFGATGLPAGLSIDSATGAITGTPTVAGLASVAISATNAAGTTSAVLTIEIVETAPEAPVISSSAGAIGQVGDPFFHALTASNFPSSFSATNLPPGLSLDATTGFITGIPTTNATTNFPIAASNAAGGNSATQRFPILASTSTASRISSAAAAAGTVGTAFSYKITATLSPNTFSASGLPPGLSVSTFTGIISGTPTTAGTFAVSVTTSSASGSVRIVIGPTAPAIPIISSPAGMNAYVTDGFGYRITASNAPASFAATGLPAGLVLNSTTGWITGTPTTSGTFNVSLSATNATGSGLATLKIVVASGPLVLRVTSAAGTAGIVGVPFTYTLAATGSSPTFTINSTLPAGLTYSSTTKTISGTPLGAGISSIAVSVSTSTASASGTITITIFPGPQSTPVFSCPAAARGAVGADFTFTATASNLPTTFSAVNLPPGLALDAASGLIFGRVNAAGNYAVALTATNALGQGQATVTFHIGAVPPPVITNNAALSATLGAAGVIARITATNGPHQFTATGLPPGLSLDPASGAISGTLTTAGVYAAQISATNAGGTATATITFTIAPRAAPVFSGSAFDSGFVGFSFSGFVSISNSPVNVSATGMPPGLSVSTFGSITGVPTTAGIFPVVITATNSGGSASAIFTIAIAAAPPPPALSGNAGAAGEVGTAFSFSLSATEFPDGISVPATFGATGLPPGLNLSAESGSITGKPATAGIFMVNVFATNVSGTTSAVLTIVIAPAAPPVITSALGATGYLARTFSTPLAAIHAPTSLSATGLPPGLNVNPATGQIAGVPTTTGEYLATVIASNSAGSGSAQMRLRILATDPTTPVITSAASVAIPLSGSSGAFGDPRTVFSYTIKGAGAPASFTATGLPQGLVLNPWTGTITGRPAIPGIFQVPVSATGPSGTSTATITVIVPVDRPVLARAASIRGQVGISLSLTLNSATASIFQEPTFPDTYTAVALPPGLSLNSASGDISGKPTTAGIFTVIISKANLAGTTTAPLTFIIENTAPTPAPLRFVSTPAAQAGALGAPFDYEFRADGQPTSLSASNLPPGLSFSLLEGLYNGVLTKYGKISGTPTVAGTFTVPLFAQNATASVNAIATFAIAIAAPAPVVWADASARGMAGSAFSLNLFVYFDEAAGGSPVSYAVANLPPGLTLDSSTHIGGVPQTTGTFVVPISATRAGITGNAFVTIVIGPPVPPSAPPVLTGGAGALGFVGVPFEYRISGKGADNLTIGVLPPGLVTTSSDGSINGAATKYLTVSGFPTSAGIFTFSISAQNAIGTATAQVTVTIVAPQAAVPFIVQQSSGLTVAEGGNAVFNVQATGTPAPVFQWFRDRVPIAGATASSFQLSGVTSADAASYSVVASNASGMANSADMLLTIAASYAQWQAAHFSPEEIAAGLAAPDFDFNADGVANLLDYALARDPRTGSGGTLPIASRTGPGGRLRLAFTRDASRADLIYLVEASNDLTTWTDLARSVSGAATTSIGTAAAVSESGGVLRNVIVDDAQIPAASPERFLRLRITLP